MFKNNLKKISPYVILSLLFLSIVIFPFQVKAADVTREEGSIANPLKADSFTELAGNIIDWIANIGIAVAVIMIIYSGLLFMTSGGNEEKVTKARKTLIWSLIGLAILIIGKGFVSIVEKLLGVSS